ncbi:hypothetical protein GCM10011519_22230 [Marmoricola endophyticus]|uniref:EcsC family protein n=1 Tax=Marmoricola endophyticus TaxID=2040280 RepID=A0A917BIW8_9ACTN|nr:EcsC family protein [Marmoricola endophyticus]GGF47736.1 hypothetical protein GCM10011519_22230 [Marmoricola endophyticus]
MGISGNIGRRLAPKAAGAAPKVTTTFVREALKRAIEGVGPLPGAAAAAEAQLKEQHGDAEKAVHEIIENHVRWSGLQGFATNLGGLVTLAVTVPTNVTGLTLLQCRMVAAVAHLRGYDLDDPRVRNAILLGILGEETIAALLKKHEIPGTPMAVATAPVHDDRIDRVIATQVASAMIARVAGKRIAVTAGKRVPLVGGAIGAGTDAYSTWKLGRYVQRELLPRPKKA